MKTKALLLVLGISLLAAGPAAAAPVIDQEQAVIDTSSFFVYAIGGGSEQKLAQVVTPGMTGGLTALGLSLACEGELTVEIQDVSAGIPNGSVLGAQTFPVTVVGLPFPTTFRTLTFSTPIAVSGGMPYAIVLSTTSSCGIWPGPIGDPYGGGDAYFDARPNAPGWILLSSGRRDLPFQTFVEPAPEEATLDDLNATVREMALGSGTEESLVAKLRAAAVALDHDVPAACRLLNAFANHVRAQAEKQLTAAQAATLLDMTLEITGSLGCDRLAA